MDANEKKYKCFFHTPFMTPPLLSDFGYVGMSRAAQQVLLGEYEISASTDRYAAQLINHLNTPSSILKSGNHPTTLPVAYYKRY